MKQLSVVEGGGTESEYTHKRGNLPDPLGRGSGIPREDVNA